VHHFGTRFSWNQSGQHPKQETFPLDIILAMNNEAEFAKLAHNFFLKKELEGKDRHSFKNMATSLQASPQAAKKKRDASPIP
jgi:hypothetical protein